MCCDGGPRTALAAVELLEGRKAHKENKKQETRNKKKKANIKVRAVKRETARSNEVRN